MIPIVHASELNLVYDANGNLVTGDGKYREYNSLNQLVRVRNGSTSSDPISEEYVHDPIAERILLKQVYNSSAQVSERVYYVDENYVRVVNATGSYDFTYVKHEGQLVAQLNPDGTKLYMHNDVEGSTGVVTNSSGNIVESTTYSPFGEVLSGGTVSRFDSEGKEFDSVVGDTDFNFRKMNPSWGIFLQPDTLISNVYDPQSLNHYSFEKNNPYRYKDENGHWAFGIGGSDSFTFSIFPSFGSAAPYGGGILISHDQTKSLSEGWDADIYVVTGVGAYVGVEAKATADVSYSHNAKSVKDIGGKFENIGGSIDFDLALGYDYSKGSGGITQHTGHIGVGEGGEGHVSVTDTVLLYHDIISPIVRSFSKNKSPVNKEKPPIKQQNPIEPKNPLTSAPKFCPVKRSQ